MDDVILSLTWVILIPIAAFFFNRLVNDLDTTTTRVSELEKELSKNYYDKEEIRENIVEPLLGKFSEIANEVKILASTVDQLHRDLLIKEAVDEAKRHS